MSDAGTIAAVYAALFAGHQVADHWIQTQHQADTKGLPGWPGRLACAAHVVTYGAAQLVALGLLAVAAGVTVSPGRLAAGMAVNLLTHYLADRRAPLRWLADRTGSGRFWRLGTPRAGRDDNPSIGTGAYALDQSWHHGWLFVAALMIGGTTG
ncbi:transcriptional regulator [Micromonospora fulviviridis]|uniref:Transcriptional regulator n=1 Tax=Micromonospora fulviviridis TaxID=47860 RepID=A0ABV2VS26_9ACTN